MTEYYIGQIFIDTYPEEAAAWCNEGNGYIDEIEPKSGKRRFQIKEQPAPIPIDVDNLTMTALDFVNFIRSCGLSLQDIKEYLAINEELDAQLTYCKDVYCGVVKQILPIEWKGITITKDMVEQAFIEKKGIKYE